MTHPTNWPNPERPGVPFFPERDGAHAIQVPDLEETEIVYYWHQNGGGWTEYNHQGAEDFLTDEDMKGWIYKGPCLTPTQIAKLLAGERERCAKVCDSLADDFLPCHPSEYAREIRKMGAVP